MYVLSTGRLHPMLPARNTYPFFRRSLDGGPEKEDIDDEVDNTCDIAN